MNMQTPLKALIHIINQILKDIEGTGFKLR